MAQIQEKFAAIAVPVWAVSLDENTVRTKARSGAKTYLPSKPDKYGVRFYAVVGWGSLYAYSVWDNGSGNKTRKRLQSSGMWMFFQAFDQQSSGHLTEMTPQ
eukprot:jgi/Phyca11/100987/e_gw1.5.1377.1